MNEFDLIREDLEKKGIQAYSCYPANNCIGVTYGNISCYYYIAEGKIVNIVYD